MPILGIMASQISGHLFAPSGAYDSIATTTLTTATASVTFSSIPATYTHLQIRGIVGDVTGGQASMLAQFNGDTATNYSTHFMTGNGSTATAGNSTTTDGMILGAYGLSSNGFGGLILDVLDYTNTNKYTTTRGLGGGDNNSTLGLIRFASGSWRNTAAVTSIKIYSNNGDLNQYTSLALYGIRGA